MNLIKAVNIAKNVSLGLAWLGAFVSLLGMLVFDIIFMTGNAAISIAVGTPMFLAGVAAVVVGLVLGVAFFDIEDYLKKAQSKSAAGSQVAATEAAPTITPAPGLAEHPAAGAKTVVTPISVSREASDEAEAEAENAPLLSVKNRSSV